MKLKIMVLCLFTILILSGCGDKKEDARTLNIYKADQVCKRTLVDEIDGESIASNSNVYLMLDDFNFVKTAIYQSETPLQNTNSYSYETYEYIRNIYSSIEGIEVIYYDTKDSLVLEVRYDYDKIDLATFRDKIGDMIDENSLLGKEKSIPVTLEKFKLIELGGYVCEVKE